MRRESTCNITMEAIVYGWSLESMHFLLFLRLLRNDDGFARLKALGDEWSLRTMEALRIIHERAIEGKKYNKLMSFPDLQWMDVSFVEDEYPDSFNEKVEYWSLELIKLGFFFERALVGVNRLPPSAKSQKEKHALAGQDDDLGELKRMIEEWEQTSGAIMRLLSERMPKEIEWIDGDVKVECEQTKEVVGIEN